MNEVQIKNVYPLTPMQKGMLYHTLAEPDNPIYFQQTLLTIGESLDLDKLEESLNILVQRHDMLRTVFIYEGVEEPLQVVLSERKIRIQVNNIQHMNEKEQVQFVEEYEKRDRNQLFKLDSDALLRLTVFPCTDHMCRLLLSFSHLIMDGWCVGTIAQELFRLYRGLPLDTPVASYNNYAEWLLEQDESAAIEYWGKYLEGVKDVTILKKHNMSVKTSLLAPNQWTGILDANLSRNLTQLAAQHQVTLSTLYQTMWGILLQHYNSCDDVIFGTVVSGRPAEIFGIDHMVGLFINTVPVRIVASENDLLSEVLKNVQDGNAMGDKYHYISLADIQQLTPLNNQLISHLFVYENYPISEQVTGLGSEEALLPILNVGGFEQTNYDFTIDIIPGKEFSIQLTYNSEKFEDEWIKQLGGHYIQLLRQVVEFPNRKIGEFSIMTNEEQERIIGFNNPQDRLQTRQILHLIEQQAKLYPDRVAIIHGNESMSFDKLWRNSNKIARRLLEEGVHRESIVGIYGERSPDLLVAMLGAWKAGAAYLPIDAEYPQARIEYMLKDSSAVIMLTDKPSSSYEVAIKSINIQSIIESVSNDKDVPEVSNGNQLAYMIYTSGTTGKPKGIMIEHRNLTDYVCSFVDNFQITERDRVLHHSSISFDTSIEELFPALLVGGSVVMISKYDLLEPKLLVKELQLQKVTVVSCSPLLLQELNKVSSEYQARLYISGGDVLKKSYFSNLIANSEVYNSYGPTETTVCATYYRCSGEEGFEHLPIGTPVRNKQVYIINHRNQLQPVGVSGEICISGAGTARGYVNLPDLTSEKFIEHPFIPGEKLYRTGDLGVGSESGNIEFLGRMDHQVKIRGYRIETGEIEALLTDYECLEDAIVVAVEHGGELSLCAYFLAEVEISAPDLGANLSRYLPDYMIPAYFVQLKEFPTNTNGKVERAALPNPIESLGGARNSEPPIGELECRIAELWEQMLGISKIGRDESFFELGGHSLKAISLISKMNLAFESSLSIRDIFNNPTIKQLAVKIGDMEKADYQMIKIAPNAQFYPVSSAQRRLLVLHEFYNDSTAYHMTAAFMIEGIIDIKRIESSLFKLIERHDALRTSFKYVEGKAVQCIEPNVDFQLEHWDSAELGSREIEENILRFIRPFDLTSAPLFRAGLIKHDDSCYMLVLDMHHLIADGSSIEVLVSEFNLFYQGKQLHEIRLQYKDYAVWQDETSANGELEQHRKYWMQKLHDSEELKLPLDYTRPPMKSFQGEGISMQLNAQSTIDIRRTALEMGTTVYNVVLAAYYVLLYKYSGQSDLIIGTPIAGRPRAELQSVVGMFVNMLPLRNQVSEEWTFRQLVEQVQETFIEAHDHQACGLDDILQNLGIERDLSRNPLFETAFVFQNTGNEPIQLNGISVRPLEISSKIAKFDLTLTAEDDSAIKLTIDYNTGLFKQETMQAFLEHYVYLLIDACSNTETLISGLNYMSRKEKERIMKFSHGQRQSLVEGDVLHKLVELQVERTPNRISVVMGDREWTYRQLNDYANHLAHVITRNGIVPGDRIGLLLEPCPESAATILAVLKAGASYVPLDSEHPVHRIAHLINDSGIKLLITNGNSNLPADMLIPCIRLDHLSMNVEENSANLDVTCTGSGEAYVIYTSGTTGQPKGVVISHEGVSNTIQWRRSAYGMNQDDAVLQLFHYTFDGFVTSFFTPLISGSKVVFLRRSEVKDPCAIQKALTRYCITHFIIVPPLYNALLEYLSTADMPSVKSVTLAGDQTTPELVRVSKDKFPHIELANEYGPTENSVASTYQRTLNKEKTVTIGQPIWNTNIYITNRDGQLQPVGIPGEIMLSGVGLSSGYVKHPEMTEGKFITDLFNPGQRMFRTGDFGRWLSDGSIQCLGRTDHQLKIRGYRIEPGEIESVLLSLAMVKEAVVTVYGDSSYQKKLCAYVVLEADMNTSPDEISSQLEKKLPNYMIPSVILVLERMPLTGTGKLDRSALPKPVNTIVHNTVERAPANEQEIILLAVWKDVLGQETIGLEDNFFGLGGDSIKAIQVASRLRSYGYAMEVKHLFQHPTIAGLSRHVTRDHSEINQDIVTGDVILTPIQRWFWALPFDEKHHFNQSVFLYRKEGFLEKIVKEVFEKIILHHDALRMTFRKEKEGSVKAYNRNLEGSYFDWEFVVIQDNDVELEKMVKSRTDSIQKSMNLLDGPLVKLCLFRSESGDHLFISVHHLVVDGISWRILLEDFSLGYEQGVAGQPIELPKKTVSVKQWAETMLVEAESGRWEQERAYWNKYDNLSVSHLPQMPTDPVTLSCEGTNTVVMTLNHEYTNMLIQQANQTYNTETNDLLLTGLYLAIHEWSGLDKLLIQTEGHGREDVLGLDISRTVGWFTSMYPILLQSERLEDLSYTIRFIKDSIRRIPNKGIGYGILNELTTTSAITEGVRLNPEISFNYLGQFDEDQKSGLFQFSTLPKGEEISKNMPSEFRLELNGMIAENQLTFYIDFDTEYFDEGHVQRLSTLYREWLQTIILHCLNQGSVIASPTDFVYDDISIDDFEELAQLLDQKISG